MSIKRTVSAAVVLAHLCISTECSAASFELVTIGEDKPVFVLVKGDLLPGDNKTFIAQTMHLDRALIVFQSRGGSILAGIEIGKAIRLKEFNSYVPAEMLCASACAVAWLGGAKRLMSKSAKIGFHAAYLVDGEKKTESGMANALIGGYLNSLGLPQSAIAFVTAASPESIQWLTSNDAERVGIPVTLFDFPATPELASKPSDATMHRPSLGPGSAQTDPGAAPPVNRPSEEKPLDTEPRRVKTITVVPDDSSDYHGSGSSNSKTKTIRGTTAVPEGTGGYAVHFGAVSSEKEARKLERFISATYGISTNLKTTSVSGSEQVIYRVLATGFSYDSANSACSRIKKSGGECFVAPQ